MRLRERVGQWGASLRRTARAHPRWAEACLVAVILVGLEALVFWSYFSGSGIPKFDFTAGYNVEAYAWWHDGSFFHPPQWMRYMYGGYPAVANVQNSSYYLPVGLTSWFTDFTLHASAVLSALHVAFSAAGVYVFLRRWSVSIWSSAVGMTAWFFAPGFFAHATHLDIMRAYAWLPWVLLITSVKWPWHRSWWSVPLATLLLWQALLASYPGTLVALAYTVPVWVAANLWMTRPKLREYLLPLAGAGVAAAMMTALRFLPVMLTRGTYPVPEIADTSYFSPAMVGTVLFPEVNVDLGWFREMSSNFVPASLVALVAFAPWRHRLARVFLALGAVAVICGLPIWPWHDLFSKVLPGMNLSRFRMADFRLVAVFCVLIIAVLALEGLLRPTPTTSSTTTGLRRAPVAVLGVFATVFAVVGVRYGFQAVPSITQVVVLVASAAILVTLASGRVRMRKGAVVAALGALTVASGVVQAAATSELWVNDRVQVERETYGATVSELLGQRHDGALVQRPARLPTPAEYTGPEAVSSKYGAVFYSGGSSVVGYINLRGTETFQMVRQQLEAPEPLGGDTRRFWEAAGMVIEGAPESMPTAAATSLCAESGECGEHLTALPVAYGTDGHFVYDLDAAAAVPVMLNEAHYRGWHAQLCSRADLRECRTVVTERGAAGQVTVQIPKGEWRLSLDYRLPGQRTAWLLFVGGLAGAGSCGGALTLSAGRARRRFRSA